MILGQDTNPFPHRQTCEWIEQGDGLEARVCEDGSVLMWKDDQRNVWLPHEKPPRRWRKFFRQHHSIMFGAVPDSEIYPGGCPEHPSHKPTPLAKIRRLQNALRSLSTRVKDKLLHVAADGLVGPHTVNATNHGLQQYVPGFTTAPPYSKRDVVRLASQITAHFEQAGRGAPASAPSAPAAPFVATTQPVVQQTAPDQGAQMPGYYPPPGYAPQPAYYPSGYAPAYYAPPRGPGGLRTDEATFDVRTFIPAQYEHLQIHPGTGMAVVVVGVVVALMLARDKKHSRKES